MTKRNVTDRPVRPTQAAIRRSARKACDSTASRSSRPARTTSAVYLIESGSGTFWADASHFAFGPGSLLFFVPYQHIRFVPDVPVHGEVIQFHANFLCVETFHAEVGCSGILFNDPYGIPVVPLDERAKSEVTNLIERIRTGAGRA